MPTGNEIEEIKQAMLDATDEQSKTFERWKAEIDYATKDTMYQEWVKKSERIVKKYRDDRQGQQTGLYRRKFNILWSNVQTLIPALYDGSPSPVVQRRFSDPDPAARLASTILQRCLSVQMENTDFDKNVGRAVLDRLLVGLGQVWIRYEPSFEADEEIPALNREVQMETRADGGEQEIEEVGDGTPYVKLAYERVCVDYIHYNDFLWGSARFWGEVPWVARRVWMTTSEIAEAFYDGDLEQAGKISLDYTPNRATNTSDLDKNEGFFKKASIWEIWNKADQTVYFIAPNTPGVILKQEKNPVLQLEGFWPCPEPMLSTTTNETIIPVPDYVEYQDQAEELNDLTARIAVLTSALRANGVYDASVPQLATLMQEGSDNRLIPVDEWAQFAEKGGMEGAISLVPMQEIATVLTGLYQARDKVKQDLYEISGIADVIRGAGAASETATAQRIKGQYAGMRIDAMRGEVQRVILATVRICAEIIAEMFSSESLSQMSGVGLLMQEAVEDAMEAVPPPQPPQPQPGQPPVDPRMLQMQYEQMKQQVAQKTQMEELEKFNRAVEILRSDKLRGFRVEIETENSVAADRAAEQQAISGLIASTMQALGAAAPMIQQAPELLRPIGGLIMAGFRRFDIGREVEASLDTALEQMAKKLDAASNNPPPPTPEMMKIELEKAKLEADQQMQQARLMMDQQKMQADMAMQASKAKAEDTKSLLEAQKSQQASEAQRVNDGLEAQIEQLKAQLEMSKIELEQEKIALERERMANERAKMAYEATMRPKTEEVIIGE